MKCRADQIQIGDRLQGKTVKRIETAIPPTQVTTFFQFDDGTFCYLPNWLEVEVERPEPPITVTIELTVELAEHAKGYVDSGYGMTDDIVARVGLAFT